MDLEQSATSVAASSTGKVAAASRKAPAPTRSSMRSYRDMSYREKPATPNSPSGTTVTTMYDHLLSPPSPAAPEPEEKDDRLRNDLLDEICNDMGIDDSMDLDFDDFCYSSSGQQKTRTGRFIATPNKPGAAAPATANLEAARRNSSSAAAPTTSGYATSDSLCAIAKLTQSINNEGRPQPGEGVDTASESGGSHENMKIEPLSETRDEPVERVNESDQSKQRAAADKRKREEEAASEAQHASCAMDSGIQSATTTMSSWQSGNYTSSQASTSSRQAQPASLDYYHQDDFTMEDMTAPDTMINFSEMPQQPNYYQLPQSSQDQMSVGFNMSLTHGSTTPNFPSTTAAHSSLPHQTNPFQRLGAGYNAQMESQQSFRSPATAHSQYPFAAGRQFNPCQAQGGSNSAPASMQPIFGRSDSAPAGSTVQPSSGSAAPNTASQTPTKPSSPHPSQVSTGNTQTTNSAAASTSAGQASSSSTGSTPTFNSSQQGFMQRLVTDKSSAFRSHPLFPLLRDLIIADMNFHEPTFPHQLIRDLPSDFNKLLKNYLSRNPPRGNYQSNHSVESVVLDALKYAHHTLIEKIQKKKSVEQAQGQPQAPPSMPAGPIPVETQAPPTSSAQANVSEYCVKFENSVRDMSQAESDYGRPNMAFRQPARMRDQPASMYTGLHSPYSHSPLSVDTASHLSPSSERPSTMYPTTHQPPQYTQSPLQSAFGRSMSVPNARNPYMNPHAPCPPPNYTVSPNNPPLPRHQQLYEMGPPSMYHDGMSPYGAGHDPYGRCMPPPNSHLMYVNNINNEHLVKTMMEGGKDPYGDETMSVHSMQGSTKVAQQGKQTEGRKHASLPKEAVNIMLNWLREHQDKPYPNDDEKGMLIKQTGLSITQINYWFTNARRRLLPKWRGEDM